MCLPFAYIVFPLATVCAYDLAHVTDFVLKANIKLLNWIDSNTDDNDTELNWCCVLETVAIDGDDPHHLDWIYQRSLERAEEFRITGVTYRLTQGLS